MYPSVPGYDSEVLTPQQEELLDGACSKVILAAQSAGLEIEDIIALLRSGMSCRDLLDVIASQLDVTIH